MISNETKTGTQTLDSFSDTIDLRTRQEPETDSQEIDSYASELTLRSVDERIKQANDPVLRRVAELCALLTIRSDLESKTGTTAA